MHNTLTKNPDRLLTVHVYLPFQLTHHFMQALNCVRYAIGFKALKYDPIYQKSRDLELLTRKRSGSKTF